MSTQSANDRAVALEQAANKIESLINIQLQQLSAMRFWIRILRLGHELHDVVGLDYDHNSADFRVRRLGDVVYNVAKLKDGKKVVLDPPVYRNNLRPVELANRPK